MECKGHKERAGDILKGLYGGKNLRRIWKEENLIYFKKLNLCSREVTIALLDTSGKGTQFFRLISPRYEKIATEAIEKYSFFSVFKANGSQKECFLRQITNLKDEDTSCLRRHIVSPRGRKLIIRYGVRH
jgi:hypothetical protein